MKFNRLLFALVLLVAACGGGPDGEDEATPQPSATPTPEPTLAFEERIEFVPGTKQNPFQMMIRPVDTVERRVSEILDELSLEVDELDADDDTFAALNEILQRDFGVQISSDEVDELADPNDLVDYVRYKIGLRVSDDIFERTSLYVEIVPVDDYAVALSALCTSGEGVVAIPWLDGVTYAAAMAQNCGQPALQVARGGDSIVFEEIPESTPESTVEATDEPETEEGDGDESVSTDALRTGTVGLIITNDGIQFGGVELVSGQTYCHTGLDDFFSWFLPALMIEQQAIDPLRAPAEFVEFETENDLIEAVQDGDCQMTGISEDMFDELEPEDVRIVDESIVLPYGILMYPLEVELGIKLSLTENLQALALDPEQGRRLRLLLGQSQLLEAVPDDFAELDEFLAAYDFAELGN